MPAKTTTKKIAAAKQPSTPKKRVAKKATGKKSPVMKELCSACLTVVPEQAFWINNGLVIDSLKGLKQALHDMTDEQFAYHTERAGNDFAAWVRDCLGDQTMAVRIAKAHTKAGAARVIVCTCPA